MSAIPTDARRIAPATARNRDPILDVLRAELPASGTVLEIASGSGEHIVHFARALPHLRWQPSDPSPEARASVAAWTQAEELSAILPPIALDAADDAWPIGPVEAILCINMVHISPWAATKGLIAGAAARLPDGGLLYLYGPYRRTGMVTAPSNEAFDEDLRRRDPRWGLRLLDDVSALAAEHGFGAAHVIEMPANNISILYRKLA
ncbi:MAG: DUF938 domain-containing protein [Sphingomonas bacterium]